MASLKWDKASCPTILFAAKTRGKTRLVQYVIIAKNPFKTSIDALQVIVTSQAGVGYHCYYTRPRAKPEVEC